MSTRHFSATLVAALLIVPGFEGRADSGGATILWAVFENLPLNPPQPKDGFQPAAKIHDSAWVWTDHNHSFQNAKSHLAALLSAGIVNTPKSISHLTEAELQHQFFTDLLGKDGAEALRSAGAKGSPRDGFQAAATRKQVKNWVDEDAFQHIGMLIGGGLVAAEDRAARPAPPQRKIKRQPNSLHPGPTAAPRAPQRSTQNKQPASLPNPYATYNKRYTAALNSNNRGAIDAIGAEMKQRNIPLSPASARALDAWMDREVGKATQGLRDSYNAY